MRLFVEIKNSNGHYHGGVYQDNRVLVSDLPELALSPNEQLIVNGNTYDLGAFIQNLMADQSPELTAAFNERGQLEVGQFLYKQIFRGMDTAMLERLRHEKVEVRVITEDEHIARLPWALLAANGVFLSTTGTTGWSVALGSGDAPQDCELPPSPRILMVMPEPAGLPKIDAEQHLEELEDTLSTANYLHTIGRHLIVAKTWEEFKQAAKEFKPHVVYYYGHGTSDGRTSALVFAEEAKLRPVEKPVADVANCLRQADGNHPSLAYINCCLGDAGGWLGVGRQLGNFIPAVITNCTTAYSGAARKQGLVLLRSMIVKGEPPHAAIASMRSNLGNLNLSFRDMRWMTPVLHCNYGNWQAHPPRPPHPLERDPHWRFKLDRVRQFGQVFYQTKTMLSQHKPRSLAYIWYGKEGQGVDLFHQRLKVELQEELSNVHLYEVLPAWPLEFYNFHRSMTDMLAEAFKVQSLEEIPDRIRTETRAATDRQVLLYVRHEPVRPGMLLSPDLLKKYLEWWDVNVAGLMEDQSFALLGISFVVRKPSVFRNVLLEKTRLNAIKVSRTRVRLLDEMERLQKEDLIDFIETHNLPLPEKFRDRVLDEIMDECNGEYDKILERLKNIEELIWDCENDQTSTTGPATDDEDYN